MSENQPMTEEQKKKAHVGYQMYDWARSAFETSVVVAILPVWFAYLFVLANGQEVSIAGMTQTADGLFAFVTGLAAISVAILSPGLGVIADRIPVKQVMLRWFTIVGAGATILLGAAIILPMETRWVWLAVMFFLANVGANAASVFYNALLPHICETDEELDRVSTKAFMYGYVGGGLLLAVHLGLVLGVTGDWVVPFCLSSSGVWWFGFAIYTFKGIPEPEIVNPIDNLSLGSATKLALSEMAKTIKDFRSTYKVLGLYLISYLLFIDGINSVTALGGIYGASVLGVPDTSNMAVILLIQFVAFPSAAFFIWFSKKTSTKTTIIVTCAIWCVVILGAISFAPLALENHEDHDFMVVQNEDGVSFTISVDYENFSIASGEAGSDAEFRNAVSHLYPPEEVNSTTELYEFTGESRILNQSELDELLQYLPSTRFSLSVSNGEEFESFLGEDHPVSLGDGYLDAIPIWTRDNIWQPMNIGISIQWLLIGLGAGFLLGGSQGMARSLFAQMVPESRSAEFFGFIGFFGKVAAFIGPWMYFAIGNVADSRTAIMSILMLIVAGVILLFFVDVEEGARVAAEEDAKFRAAQSEE